MPMPIFEYGFTCSKKILPIIYVIGTPGNMKGARIASLNDAMRVCEAIMREKAEELQDAEIEVGVLRFSTGAQWITKYGLVPLTDFYWNDVQASGLNDLGEALMELDRKLLRKEFLINDVGYYAPIIIFMSDGFSTDEWKKGLSVAKTNGWFNRARKIAIVIGEDADINVLSELVGNHKAVICTGNVEALKDMIVSISLQSERMPSCSRIDYDSIVDQLNDASTIAYEEPPNNGGETSSFSTDLDWDEYGW